MYDDFEINGREGLLPRSSKLGNAKASLLVNSSCKALKSSASSFVIFQPGLGLIERVRKMREVCDELPVIGSPANERRQGGSGSGDWPVDHRFPV